MTTAAAPRILVTGGSGFLGREVVRALAPVSRLVALAHRHAGPDCSAVDIRDAAEFGLLLRAQAPEVVVHLAAYKDPDFCERNPDETRRLNVEPCRTLVEQLAPDAYLLLVSSDYVFDGEHPPYRESDPCSPVCVYGRSKVEAEEIVAERGGSCILRVPLLVGGGRSRSESGFIHQIEKALLERQPIALDDVQMRFPLWTRDVARAIHFLIERRAGGVFHLGGPRGATRYAWTIEAARRMGRPAEHIRPSHEPDLRVARRPPNSQLDSGKLLGMGFPPPHDFSEILPTVVQEWGTLNAPE